jgi:hypothetical protein
MVWSLFCDMERSVVTSPAEMAYNSARTSGHFPDFFQINDTWEINHNNVLCTYTTTQIATSLSGYPN